MRQNHDSPHMIAEVVPRVNPKMRGELQDFVRFVQGFANLQSKRSAHPGRARVRAWTRRFDAPGGVLEKGAAYGRTNGLCRLFRFLGRHRDHRSRDVEEGVKSGDVKRK